MASVLDSHLAEIPDLCRRYGVSRLELFGSATTDVFDPQRSDLDFLVQFDAVSSGLFDRYFGLKESLEELDDDRRERLDRSPARLEHHRRRGAGIAGGSRGAAGRAAVNAA